MIQKRAVDLPPALTILSQTAFGIILGLPGLMFATPITAALLAVANKATSPLDASDAAAGTPCREQACTPAIRPRSGRSLR